MIHLELFFQFWLPPILTTLVSIIYFRASPRTQPIRGRIAVSVHGVAIAVLYFGAILFAMTGRSSPAYGSMYSYLSIVPVVLIIFSLIKFRGHRLLHLLHLINLFGGAWQYFIGGMAVTGVWL